MMEMDQEDQYGMMDQITHYMINGPPILPAIPQPPRDLHYAMVMLGGGNNAGGGVSFGSDSTMGMLSTTSGFSGDSGSGSGNGLNTDIDGRWSKEETLALLDIRSRLDPQFKEANHKGPLWEEVSRIMYTEHGYKRSRKKCSVKFENLYKYYKKIKDGKTGKARRQDKKHYRFFNQLEAIYGKPSNSGTNLNPNNVSAMTLQPFMDENDDKKSTMGKKPWKTAITDYIETKMNTLMEKQEKWMEKMMNSIEEKEEERILKEEQRRKEEASRLEMVKKFRSNELAWMQSRDSTIMEALHKLTNNESVNIDQNPQADDWGENEITQLINLRSGMETRFEACVFMENVLWEEIALTMGGLGYNRSALNCKAKWDHINFLLTNKKQKGCLNIVYAADHHHNHKFHDAAGERYYMAMNAQQNDCEMMWSYNGNV